MLVSNAAMRQPMPLWAAIAQLTFWAGLLLAVLWTTRRNR